jgi:uncharacterized protein YaiI (UPF0178 family)
MARSKENSREGQESPVVALACDTGITIISPRGNQYIQTTINSEGQFSEVKLTERQYLHKMIRMAKGFIDPQAPRDNARLYIGTTKASRDTVRSVLERDYSK